MAELQHLFIIFSLLAVHFQAGSAVVAAAAADADDGRQGKLVFAHVIYRHGDRTPIEPYPTDPWKDLQYWPTGYGQLTNIGKQQHYMLGEWLRQRYDSLLNRTYSKDEIYVRSTDVDRTLMSALSNLAGLYPPTGDQIWKEDLAWQPIPVHTTMESDDYVLAGKASCPAYDYAFAALKNTPEFRRIYDRYSYLFNYLTQYSGRMVESLEDIQRINNTLFIEQLYNKTLPEWTKKVYPSADMTFVANFAFKMNTYTRNLARLKTGPLIKEMLERFDSKWSGSLKPNRSVWVYSAHDTTVANVLNTLRLFDVHSPPYTAAILLEMRVDAKKQPLISIFYKNTTAEPTAMVIPGCGTACPLHKMFALYKDILPEDWECECKLTTMMLPYEEANVGAAMAILLTVISVLMVLSYMLTIAYRRRNYWNYVPYSQMA